MPIGLKLLLILLLSGSLVATGVCVGFAAEDIFALVCAVPAVVIAFISLLFLLKDYMPKKNKKTSRWYVDKFLAALVPVWVLSAIFLIAVGADGNEMAMYAGSLMFPVISILIAPNAAMYAVKDMKDWKKVFYGNGNLHSFKDTKEFFMMKAPVDFEKKLFRAVVRDQILNITTLISLMFVGAVAGLYAILTYVM